MNRTRMKYLGVQASQVPPFLKLMEKNIRRVIKRPTATKSKLG